MLLARGRSPQLHRYSITSTLRKWARCEPIFCGSIATPIQSFYLYRMWSLVPMPARID